MNLRFSCIAAAAVVSVVSALPGCTAELVDNDAKEQASGVGAAATGGAATGGAATGGTGTGGVGTGGLGTGGFVCDLNNSGDNTNLGPDTGEVMEPTFETLKGILQGSYGCTGSDCHAGSEHTPMQLVIDDSLYSYLTTHVSTGCCNLKVVDPGYPARSAIIRVLKGECGEISQMPNRCIPGPNGDCLPVNYVTAIEQWIAAGAPQQ
jgi:hypothetical protein